MLAFEPWNVPHYPGSSTSSTMVSKVADTSTMTWQAIDQYGWTDWRNVVSLSIDTNSTDPTSLGRVYNDKLKRDGLGQITIREIQGNEKPDLQHYAVPTTFLEAKCGTWATACVYLLNPLPITAYYKAAAMTQWNYATGQAPVVRHETNHPLSRACDQYRGGCPRAVDGRYESEVVCTGNPDTLMDCGGAARTATEYDYNTFKTAFRTDAPFLQSVVCQTQGYDPCSGRWKMPDGFSYDPITGDWYNPQGTPEWSKCSNGNRFNHYKYVKYGLSEWTPQGNGFYDTSRGYWSFAPSC